MDDNSDVSDFTDDGFEVERPKLPFSIKLQAKKKGGAEAKAKAANGAKAAAQGRNSATNANKGQQQRDSQPNKSAAQTPQAKGRQGQKYADDAALASSKRSNDGKPQGKNFVKAEEDSDREGKVVKETPKAPSGQTQPNARKQSAPKESRHNLKPVELMEPEGVSQPMESVELEVSAEIKENPAGGETKEPDSESRNGEGSRERMTGNSPSLEAPRENPINQIDVGRIPKQKNSRALSPALSSVQGDPSKTYGVALPPHLLCSKILHDKSKFTPRIGYCTAFSNGFIYIYGGFKEDGITAAPMLRFSPSTNKFALVPDCEKQPQHRSRAVFITLKAPEKRMGKIFLHGGVSMQNVELNDAWLFDTISEKWEKWLPVSSKASLLPPARKGHSAATSAKTGKIYIFGGIARGEKTPSPEGYILGSDGNWSKWKYAPKTIAPSGRCGQAMACWSSPNTGAEAIYLFGGDVNGKGTACSELWRFSLGTGVWRLLEDLQGEKPQARFNCGTTVTDNRLWICGGECGGWFGTNSLTDLYSYDFQLQSWFGIDTDSKDLGSLSSFGPICYSPQNGALYVFGGTDSKGRTVGEITRLAPLCTSVNLLSMKEQLQNANTAKQVEGSIGGNQEERFKAMEQSLKTLADEFSGTHEAQLDTIAQMQDQILVSSNLQRELSAVQEHLQYFSNQTALQLEKLSAENKVLTQRLGRLEALYDSSSRSL